MFFAFEFRNESWLRDPKTFGVLSKNHCGYCIAENPDLSLKKEVTADFAYVRLHGKTEWYNYEYSEQELEAWARSLKTLCKDVEEMYVHFNNDPNGWAVKNALTLQYKIRKRQNTRFPWPVS